MSDAEAADFVRQYAQSTATDEQIEADIANTCRLMEEADGDAPQATALAVEEGLESRDYYEFLLLQIAAVQSQCTEFGSDYLDRRLAEVTG